MPDDLTRTASPTSQPVIDLATAAALIYTAVLLLWLLLRTLSAVLSPLPGGTFSLSGGTASSETWLPLHLLNSLGIWLFLPLFLLAPWVLLAGRRLGAAVLFVPLAIFLMFYGHALLPPRARPEREGPSVRIVTFNVRYDNYEIDAIASTLLAADADVIALQEITEPQRRLLEAALADDYPYRVTSMESALALYSRHPILEEAVLPLQMWPGQSVVIQVAAGVSLHLINAHLAPAGVLPLITRLDPGPAREFARIRDAQVATIREAVRLRGMPAVVACDCNMTDLTAAYAQMTKSLKDAHREGGRGLGHTFLVPRGLEIPSPWNVSVQRIDYLFHTPDLEVRHVDVLRSETGSDHRPVLGEFSLAP